MLSWLETFALGFTRPYGRADEVAMESKFGISNAGQAGQSLIHNTFTRLLPKRCGDVVTPTPFACSAKHDSWCGLKWTPRTTAGLLRFLHCVDMHAFSCKRWRAPPWAVAALNIQTSSLYKSTLTLTVKLIRIVWLLGHPQVGRLWGSCCKGSRIHRRWPLLCLPHTQVLELATRWLDLSHAQDSTFWICLCQHYLHFRSD